MQDTLTLAISVLIESVPFVFLGILLSAVVQVWLCLALVPLIGSLITEPAAGEPPGAPVNADLPAGYADPDSDYYVPAELRELYRQDADAEMRAQALRRRITSTRLSAPDRPRQLLATCYLLHGQRVEPLATFRRSTRRNEARSEERV